MNGQHYHNNITAMRLLAACTVIFTHSFVLYDRSKDPLANYLKFLDSGSIALSVFFIVSGYLITASLDRSPGLLRFAISRILRVFPGLAAVVLLTVLLLGPLCTSLSVSDYFRAPLTWSYLSNIFLLKIHYRLPGVFADTPYAWAVNGSIWTLQVELALYIMAAVLSAARLLRPRIILALALCLLTADAILHETALLKNFMQAPLYHLLQKDMRWVFFFWAGSACYLWRKHIPFTSFYLWLVLIAGVLSWYALPYGRYVTYGCLPYILLYMGLGTRPVAQRFFDRYDLSYGVYLYAFPIQQAYMHFIGTALGFIGFLCLPLLLTLLPAYLSWKWIESPMLRLKPARTSPNLDKGLIHSPETAELAACHLHRFP